MNTQELIKILEAKLQARPGDNSIKEKLAGLLLAQANYKRAGALFEEILSKNASDKAALWGLARISWLQKDLDASYAYLNSLSSLPDYKLSKEQALLFAKVCHQLENIQEAFFWFDFAAALDSSILEKEITFLRSLRSSADELESKKKQSR